MRISDLIRELEVARAERGDLPIIHLEDVDGFFALDFEPAVSVMGIPHEDDDGSGEPEKEPLWVIAISRHFCAPTPDDKRPHLKVVK